MKKDYPDIQALENEKWQDPDPATGKLGTRVPAKWLQNTEDSIKSLTNEMLEVLREAGINADELNNTQLLAALKEIISADTKIKPVSEGGTGATTAATARTNLGLKSAATLDKTDDFGTSTSLVATQALVDKLQKEMLKATEVPVDRIFIFDGAIPPAGYIERKGMAINKEKMPKLYARYGANMPDDRDRAHRMAGTLAGTAGTTQEDAMQVIKGSAGDIYGGTNPIHTGAIVGPSTTLGTIQVSDGVPRSVWGLLFDSSRVARTSTETRVKARIIIACNKIQ